MLFVSDTCLTGMTAWSDNCYVLVDQQRTQNEAESYCQAAYCGHLASISSREELLYIEESFG